MHPKGSYKSLFNYSTKRYGMGGAIGSALGAVAGSVVPGVGTMVGSSVGGALGSGVDALTQKKQKEAPDPYMYSSSSLGQGFRKGGKVKNMKGNAKEFEGPSHEQGGIDIGNNNEVEGGETMEQIELNKGGKVTKGGQPYIFSKTLKVPGSNLSFAKYHKQLKKRGADKDEIRKLAMKQEKASGRINKTSRTGGTMKKYNKGGKLSMKQGYSPYQMAGGYRWYKGGGKLNKKTYANGGPSPFPNLGSFLSKNMPQAMANESGTSTPGEEEDQGPGFGTIAAQFVPDAINLATGLFGKDKTPQATQVDKSSVRNFPTNYNINPVLSRNAASYRAMLSDPNASGNQKMAAYSKKLQADSKAQATKQNQENQLKARRAGLESNLDSQQAGMDAQARQDRMASQANLGPTGNFARQSLSSIANKVLQMNKEKNMSERDKQMIQMLIEGYGANESHSNYLNNLINGNG